MDEKRRYSEIYRRLGREWPDARCSLDYTSAFELLVATILSAQSTDARVNQVTPGLFRKYPSPRHFAEADPNELESDLRSTGFFRQKSKAVMGASRAIVEEHGGRAPDTMEALVALPGVGRKTANVVLGNAFGKAAGVVVDTHVKRVSGRLGFTTESDPEKIEQDLMARAPKKHWTRLSHLLILHGRNICVARRPKCEECAVSPLCPSSLV